MTVGGARAILSTTWVVLSIPLIGIVFLQTINKKYEEWDTGFGWLVPLIFPVLSFIIATWTVAQSRKDKMVMKNFYIFGASMLMSVAYLAALYAVLMMMPSEIGAFHTYVKEVLRPSSWYLGTFQATVVVAVGKFFLEEIYEEAEEMGAERARAEGRRGNRKTTHKASPSKPPQSDHK
jgi:hypothetical protein